VLGTAAPAARSATVTVPTGRHVISVRAVDTLGGTRKASNSLSYVVDPDAPVVAAGGMVFRAGTAGATLPVTTPWTASDVTSGLCAQEFTGAAGTSHAFPAASRAAADVIPAGVSTFGVTATDCAGNAATAAGSVASAVRQEDTLKYSSGWATGSSAGAHGGTIRSTSKARATATTTLSARAVALVATKAKDQGLVQVAVDGQVVATVNLYAAAGTARQVVWTYSWPAAGAHKVTFTNVSSASRPRVNVDSVLSLR
jgi:hypothetical protein